MIDMMISLCSGVGVGMVFTLIRLPIPAPPVLIGVISILGVYLGTIFYPFLQEWTIHLLQ